MCFGVQLPLEWGVPGMLPTFIETSSAHGYMFGDGIMSLETCYVSSNLAVMSPIGD